MAQYSFKYHGISNDNAVFSFRSESHGWYHYKMDSGGKIKRISYQDVDLAQCNTRIINDLYDIIEESKSNSINELASMGLLDTLIERDVHLEGIGSVAFHEFKIMLPYNVKVTLSNGNEFIERYDGTDENEAVRVAKVNNPLFVRGVVVS